MATTIVGGARLVVVEVTFLPKFHYAVDGEKGGNKQKSQRKKGKKTEFPTQWCVSGPLVHLQQ